TIGSVPELTPVAIPPAVRAAACCRAARVCGAGAEHGELQPTCDGCRRRLGDSVPGSELAIEVVSPAIGVAARCQPARVETASADHCEREPTNYGRWYRLGNDVPGPKLPGRVETPAVSNAVWCQAARVSAAGADRCEREPTHDRRRDRAVDGIARAKPSVTHVGPGVPSPAIGGPIGRQGAGVETAGADRCEREPPRYADGRSATWQVSDVKEETPREEDGNDWGTEGAVVVVAPTEGCPGGREPAGVVAAAAHGGKPRLSNGDRRGRW